MATSEKQKQWRNAWDAKNMTILACKVRKAYAEEVKAKAAARNTTVNAVLAAALKDFMDSEQPEGLRLQIPAEAGFTMAQIEQAAASCGQTVLEWVADAIKEKL